MLLRQLAAGFYTWREAAEEPRKEQYATGGALRCIPYQHLPMAFEKWQFEAAESKI